jgi:two-component system, chemotaxis family, chemotaxis protein CheY
MANKTILVVDDSLTVRQQVSLTLTSAGYQVVEACDGMEGVERVRGNPGLAMVLCDLNMPRMNGLEFLETIKGDAAGPPVPVVILTTDGSSELISRAKRNGAKGWIVKPFQPDLLLSAVRRIAGPAAA